MGAIVALAGELWRRLGPAGFVPLPPREGGVAYLDAPAGVSAPGRGNRSVARLADVYLPDRPGPHPSVFLVHGGGFLIGSRSMRPMRFLATRLVEAGHAVCSIDYRLLLRGARALDDVVDDVVTARAWWQAQAGRLHLDGGAMSVLGLSAGATALLLALARDPRPLPAHVVSAYGIYDLAGLRGPLPGTLRRMLLGGASAEACAARSPLALYDLPAPLTLIHGTRDGFIPAEQARRFEAERARRGLPARLVLFEGAPHGFFNDTRGRVARRGLDAILEGLGAVPGGAERPAMAPPPQAPGRMAEAVGSGVA